MNQTSSAVHPHIRARAETPSTGRAISDLGLTLLICTLALFVLSVGAGVAVFTGIARSASPWIDVIFIALVVGFLISFVATISRRAGEWYEGEISPQDETHSR